MFLSGVSCLWCSQDMEKDVSRALRGGSQDEVLSEGFRLTITRKDLQTLNHLNWLNDEVRALLYHSGFCTSLSVNSSSILKWILKKVFLRNYQSLWVFQWLKMSQDLSARLIYFLHFRLLISTWTYLWSAVNSPTCPLLTPSTPFLSQAA